MEPYLTFLVSNCPSFKVQFQLSQGNIFTAWLPQMQIFLSVVFNPLLPKEILLVCLINCLTPNNPYMGRTEPLTSKRYILCIYSTNIGTEYFKHALYPPFFSLQNAVCFIMLTCLVPVLFTFYIQGVLKFKK